MVRKREKRKTYEELDRKKRKEQVKRHAPCSTFQVLVAVMVIVVTSLSFHIPYM